METEKAIHDWMEGAKRDLVACEHLYEGRDYPQCLFWGHLVIEKLLKALIIKQTGSHAPFSHDLMLLATKAKIDLDQERQDFLNEITTFNQFARYDNEVMMFIEKCNPEFVEKYFKIINDLYQWLMQFLAKSN